MVGNRSASIGSTLAAAAVISTVMVTRCCFSNYGTTPGTSRRASDYAVLFGFLWVLPVAFVMIVMPVVRALYGADNS